jgi:hypothetical protein
MWGSHENDYEDFCLLECEAMSSGRKLPMFQSNMLPPPSGLYWREHAPLRHGNTTRIHGLTPQKTAVSNSTGFS